MSWDPTNPNRFAFFLIDFGGYFTEDNGATFRFLNNPRHRSVLTALCGALDPTPNSRTIIAALGDPAIVQKFYITTDLGSTWSPTSIPEGYYQYVAFHPQNGNVIYASNYRSTDKGANWTLMPRRVIGVFQGNGDIVYSTEITGSGTNILKSTNRGVIWTTPYPQIPHVRDVAQITILPLAKSRDRQAWVSITS